jgi:threonine/homoserine/homoserine lactone efflux protein
MFSHFIFHQDIWGSALTLILASLVIMGSPGPSTISATAVGATYGFRRSLTYVCGLILGTIAVLLAVALGVVAILLSIPHGASALTAVSTIYIGYLGFRIATAPPLANRSNQVATPAFAGGLLLAIANPKAYFAVTGVFAGTIIVKDDHALDAAVKTALLGVMIIVIHVCWLVAGASLSRLLRDPAISRAVNISLAGILVVTTALALLR